MSGYALMKLERVLRRELRKRARERIDEMLAATDTETGLPMRDVLLAHIAAGRTFELDIALQIIGTPDADDVDSEQNPKIEIVRA